MTNCVEHQPLSDGVKEYQYDGTNAVEMLSMLRKRRPKREWLVQDERDGVLLVHWSQGDDCGVERYGPGLTVTIYDDERIGRPYRVA